LFDLSNLASVKLLEDASGQYIDVADWQQDDFALNIQLQLKPADSQAYVLKSSFDSTVLVPQIVGGASLVTSSTAKGSGISLPQGEFMAVFFKNAGMKTDGVQLLRVSSDTAVMVCVNGILVEPLWCILLESMTSKQKLLDQAKSLQHEEYCYRLSKPNFSSICLLHCGAGQSASIINYICSAPNATQVVLIPEHLSDRRRSIQLQ
jgi:hypothetical protein